MNQLCALATLVLLAGGCGGVGVGGSSIPKLWLALNGDELHVKLQPNEPPPY